MGQSETPLRTLRGAERDEDSEGHIHGSLPYRDVRLRPPEFGENKFLSSEVFWS